MSFKQGHFLTWALTSTLLSMPCFATNIENITVGGGNIMAGRAVSFINDVDATLQFNQTLGLPDNTDIANGVPAQQSVFTTAGPNTGTLILTGSNALNEVVPGNIGTALSPLSQIYNMCHYLS